MHPGYLYNKVGSGAQKSVSLLVSLPVFSFICKEKEKPLIADCMKKYFLLPCALLLACISLGAQNYMFKHLELKDGLSNNQVNAIYKDSEGFMWFGTASGLNRYDGYDMKVYLYEPADTTSLPDNYISSIQEDRDGRLWIHTDKGYALYDPATDRFDRHVERWMWDRGINGAPSHLYIDSAKNYWIYFAWFKQLYRYIPGQDKALLLEDVSEALKDVNLISFSESDGGLWMIDDAGVLYCLDKQSLKLKVTENGFAETMAHRGRCDYSLYADTYGRVWIYGMKGFACYDYWHHTWLRRSYCATPSDAVRTVMVDKKGQAWLGKDQDGVEIIGRDGKSVYIKNDPKNARSLPNNTVTTFYEDDAGTVWIGTYKKGVALYNESIFKFDLLELGDIHCIEDGGDEIVWLGTNGEGLLRLDMRSGEQMYFKHTPGDTRSLSGNVITSLLRDSRGRVWAGTYINGLNCYDGRRFIRYKHRSGDPNSLINDNVWALAEDAEGNIWIGTLGSGLQCLNPQTGDFVSYKADNSGLTSNWISSLCLGRQGNLWIGTTGGIFSMDMKTKKVSRFTGTRSGKSVFSNNVVIQLHEDREGRLWVATRAGLSVCDLNSDVLYEVPLDTDVSRQLVLGIVEDSQQGMWASVGGELINIIPEEDPEEKTLSFRRYIYSDKDGLQGCDFNQRSLKLLQTGEIVAGGLYGINTFRPGNIKYNEKAPHVMFTKLNLFNKEVKVGALVDGRVILQEALNRSREVVLDYKQNIFTVFLASDNYILPEKTRFYYKLEGFNDEWLSDKENLHRITYTNLAPGTYWLKVRAANGDGFSGEEEARLKIVILPPFWLTPWAYLLYTLLLIAILLLAYNWVKRHERNKYRIRQIEEDARRNEELNQMKFRFFTNVSHELRTPLTLIISPLESLIKDEHDELVAGRLKMMHRNALRLLNLVNQLLDFRKNEMAGSHLSLSEGEIVSFVQNICNSFLMLSEKKGVHATFYSAVDALDMAFDADKIGKVVMNLLSNAFKFTPDGGRVSVSLELLDNQPETLELKVADTGIGIKDEDKEHIFERFYQAERAEGMPASTGSGIGLSLVRDYVSLHGGTVQVFDNAGGGSVFVINIPVKHLEASSAVLLPASESQQSAEGVGAESVSGLPGSKQVENEKRKKPLVLIVDDSGDFVEFMKDTLDLYFSVRTAGNGKEALDVLQKCRPDLILCDWMMPVMDGKELCRRVKSDKQTADIPFVLLTAKQSVETKVEGLTVGADDYVTKPFNLEVLVLRMRKLIELSRHSKPRGHLEPEPEEIAITPLDEKLIANAIAYVEKNIARSDLSVEELSRELGMSRAHMYKKMLQITGKTPIEFIRVIRLKRAAQLLRESQQNVSEIAYQLGFNNPKYFSRYFKEEFGVLPSVYQEAESKTTNNTLK